MFADDILLFCKGDDSSIAEFMKCINLFSSCSGLRPNPNKSQVFFCNVDQAVIHNALNLTGFQLGTLPFRYLGLPLISSRVRLLDCNILIQRICNRIDSWTNGFLRFSGRLQLLKTVLFGMQNFWASHLFLPKCVLLKIQSLFAKFLWSGKKDGNCHHKVSWRDCCLPKNEGGLGLFCLHARNKASILFQVWRVSLPSPESLWIRWIHTCFLRGKSFWSVKPNCNTPWAIRQILNLRREALNFFEYSIGAHSNFFMWCDPWLHRKSLISRYGDSIVSLARSSVNKKIHEFISNGSWVNFPSNHLSISQLRLLLSNVQFGVEDAISWQGCKKVSTSLIFHSVRSVGTSLPWVHAVWHPLSIPKCSFLMWLALKNKLLTKDKMRAFGWRVDDRCVLCRCTEENAAHSFTDCPYAHLIFRGSPVPISRNWSDWQNGIFLFRKAISNGA
nr:PREDICTED: uncharacterized protein LOC108212584 [Daucus carota subsp. sativus]